jgi:hypothetical protein
VKAVLYALVLLAVTTGPARAAYLRGCGADWLCAASFHPAHYD